MFDYQFFFMNIILKYFPDLLPNQITQIKSLAPLYLMLNARVRVLPRREFNTFYEDHVLHSLAIAKVINFKPGSSILDVGTGGGFPGIPLAILFPVCHFTLIDSMHRRIKVVEDVVRSLDIKNVSVIHGRVEDIYDQYDFIVSRAVTSFPIFVALVRKNIHLRSRNKLSNGLIYLKGGSFDDEIIEFRKELKVYDISKYFTEPSFQTQKVLYLPLGN